MNKKLLLATTVFIYSQLLNAQVLYSENFDNLTVGNVGTDLTGQTPGKGNWFTIYGSTSPNANNNWFQIQNEPNKGKVITIQSPTPTATGNTSLQQRNIDQLINNRTQGNNVIKFEVDFYTGVQHNVPVANSNLTFGLTDRNDNQLSSTIPIAGFNFFPASGELSARSKNGIGQNIIKLGNNNQKLLLPFNTWVKCIIYLDYPNKKVYYEIPSLNVLVTDDFLKNDNDPNYFNKYTPKSIQAITAIEQLAATYKFDNFKVTALNKVTLSVNKALAEKFNLYPNPASNTINITNSDNYFVQNVKIYDTSGKLLKTQDFNNEKEVQLNIESFANGIYLLHIQTDKGVAVKKVVKKIN